MRKSLRKGTIIFTIFVGQAGQLNLDDEGKKYQLNGEAIQYIN